MEETIKTQKAEEIQQTGKSLTVSVLDNGGDGMEPQFTWETEQGSGWLF